MTGFSAVASSGDSSQPLPLPLRLRPYPGWTSTSKQTETSLGNGVRDIKKAQTWEELALCRQTSGLVHLALNELRAHNVKINIITHRGKTLLTSSDEYVSVIETLKTMLRGLGSQYWRRLSKTSP